MTNDQKWNKVCISFSGIYSEEVLKNLGQYIDFDKLDIEEFNASLIGHRDTILRKAINLEKLGP